MKIRAPLAALAACSSLTFAEPTPVPQDVVKEFQQTLGGALKQAINAGGPEQAIDVCHAQAPVIAQTLGEKHQLSLRRISDKPRNPDAVADTQDARVLADFASAIKGDPEAVPAVTVTTANGHSRYYQAIRVQGLCLTCHGTDVSPKVSERLQSLYPDDRATGYALGDLRGAFVVEW